MYLFDIETKETKETAGGYLDKGLPIADTFVKLGRNERGVLYRPLEKTEKSGIGVVIIHSDDDYSTNPMGGELAKRGYTAFCGQVSDPADTLDNKLIDVKNVINFLRIHENVNTVVLMGHSGGATLMSAYQAVAENGASIFGGDAMTVPCSVDKDLPGADALMLIDSNWGNGAMTLFSIDPAVTEEGDGMKLDPELDITNPANGYDPEGSHYKEAFLRQFFEAQRERNNKLIKRALDRLSAIEAGRGYYNDDEPFVIAGANQIAPCNKIFPQDISIFAHTLGEYELLWGDGRLTRERIYSLRKARKGKTSTKSWRAGGLETTVRSFLTGRAVPAGADYELCPDGARGVLYDSCYCCTPGNVKHIHVPLLCMGMTGSYEFLASEEIFNNAASRDKSIAFVRGAGHNFRAETEAESYPGEFGDTQQILYDYIDGWLSSAGRFI